VGGGEFGRSGGAAIQFWKQTVHQLENFGKVDKKNWKKDYPAGSISVRSPKVKEGFLQKGKKRRKLGKVEIGPTLKGLTKKSSSNILEGKRLGEEKQDHKLAGF